MATTQNSERPQPPFMPAKKPTTDYPLIDNDPHLFRVLRYLRTSDYTAGALLAVVPPGLLAYWERMSPSHVGKGGFAPLMRMNIGLGITAGFLLAYQRSCMRFYGVSENQREIDMDMREMTDKVKRGLPLYGEVRMSDYMQGVAARNSRYTAAFTHVIPMFNIVNHNHHGVDTAKYYQNAERELEAERK